MQPRLALYPALYYGLAAMLFLGAILILLTFAIRGLPIAPRSDLKAIDGKLSGIHCRHDRILEAIRIDSSDEWYGIESLIPGLPSCSVVLMEWAIGDEVSLRFVGNGDGGSVYELVVNDVEIYNYDLAVRGIKRNFAMVLGYAFLVIALIGGGYAIDRRRKRHLLVEGSEQ